MTSVHRRPAAQASPTAKWIAEFTAGLLQPSRLAALVGIVVFVAGVSGAAWFFTPPVLAGHLGRYLARSQQDTEAQATWRVLQLAHHPPDQPRLLILGSSITANAIGSERGMETALRDATGQDWSVSLLTTPLQTPLDEMTLVEAALGPPPGPRKPVVIAIELSLERDHASLARMLELEDTGRLGVRSSWADATVRELGGKPRRTTGIYLIDNLPFIARNGQVALTRLLLDRPAPRRLAVFAPPSPLSDAERPRQRLLTELRRPLPRQLPDYSVLARLMERLRAYPAVHVVFLAADPSPDFIAWGRLQEAAVESRQREYAMAVRHGAEFWPIFGEARLPADVFYDDLHIGAPIAQAKVRSLVADHLASYVFRKRIG
jgi:hypothetical protein